MQAHRELRADRGIPKKEFRMSTEHTEYTEGEKDMNVRNRRALRCCPGRVFSSVYSVCSVDIITSAHPISRWLSYDSQPKREPQIKDGTKIKTQRPQRSRRREESRRSQRPLRFSLSFVSFVPFVDRSRKAQKTRKRKIFAGQQDSEGLQCREMPSDVLRSSLRSPRSLRFNSFVNRR